MMIAFSLVGLGVPIIVAAVIAWLMPQQRKSLLKNLIIVESVIIICLVIVRWI